MNRILFWILLIAVTSSLCAETPGIPTISQQPLDLTITNGGPAMFSVGMSGTGPFTYQWQLNGTNVSPVVRTVAGNGVYGYSGDGGPATNANLYHPEDVASDGLGNLFIADRENHRIRKVDANGTITTVAGNGNWGYSGDGGPAGGAELASPCSIAVYNGNLFIADSGNNCIRKVDTNGIISTIAGTGVSGYSGDGVLATNSQLFCPGDVIVDGEGNLFIADDSNHRVRRVDVKGIITTVAGNGTYGYSGDGGLAIQAKLNYPWSVALDGSGNLFIADNSNNRVRKVDSNGIITTVAGVGTAGFSGDGDLAINARLDSPQGVACDEAGNLFVADWSNSRIRKVDPSGTITTIAGRGISGYSGAVGPLALDGSGNLFFAPFWGHRICKMDYLFAVRPTLRIANTGPADAGNYTVIVSTANGSVTSHVATLTVLMPPSINVQPTNQTVLLGGTGTFGVSASGTETLSYLWLRNGLPIAGADRSSYSITNVQASDSGAQFSCWVSNGCGNITSQVATLTVAFPPTITQDPTNQIVLKNNSVVFDVEVSGTGPFTYQWQLNGTNLYPIITTIAGSGSSNPGDGGPATSAVVSLPGDIAFDGKGNLFIVDSGNNRIRKVDTNGIITKIAGNGPLRGYSGDGGPAASAQLSSPNGVAFDCLGNLLIADAGNNRIRMVDASGIITTIAGNGIIGCSGDGRPATYASMCVSSIALDCLGNLFIGDSFNHLVRKVDTNGIISTIAGKGINASFGDGDAATNAGIRFASSVAPDAAGNLFIADYNCVRKVDTNGIITTVAGNGTGGFFGDGGPATGAVLNGVGGIAFDGLGNLLIADNENHRIRKLDSVGIITTIVGKGTCGYSGDGGPAINAQLYYPSAVAFDGLGNLFLSDTYNNRIRKVNYTFATMPTLTLTNVAPANSGNYAVIVRSSYGCVTSQVASLTVATPPGINTQPTDQLVLIGKTAAFGVSASGDAPLKYSWFRDGTFIVGANDASYSINNVQQSDYGAQFSCVVSNAYGSVTSRVATLTQAYPPLFNKQPVDLIVTSGNIAAFDVAASGTGPFTYQWQLNGTNLSPMIITVAGGGGYYANNSATNAVLSSPAGVTMDATGNLFIADAGNNEIRKVDTNGIIKTVAGYGTAGFNGDRGAATSARLYNPRDVAVDPSGYLFIADTSNGRIRKVDAKGIITTVAGGGSSSFDGDGGPATNTALLTPAGIAIDAAGNLFIAENFYNRIRKVNANGTITTVAGNRNGPGYSGDGGWATNTSLGYPRGMALDSAGNLFFADSYNNRIRKVDAYGIITTVAGNGNSGYFGDGGTATNASLKNPQDVAFDGTGSLIIADQGNNCIRRIDANGIITTIAGPGTPGLLGDNGPATSAALNAPCSVAFDTEGNLLIADPGTNRIRKVLLPTNRKLTVLSSFATNDGDYTVIVGTPYGSVTSQVARLTILAPPSIFLQPTNQTILVGETATFSVGASGSTTLSYFWLRNGSPIAGAHDSSYSIQNAQLSQSAQLSCLVSNAYGCVTSRVATLSVGTVPKITQQPISQVVAKGGNAQLTVTASGSEPLTYQWQFNGTNLSVVTTIAGNSGYGYAYSGDGGPATNAHLYSPRGIAVDSAGNLFIADSWNEVIRKVDANGIISTVAGNGTPGFYGDGRLAIWANLYYPEGIAVDAAGNLIIADSYNKRIRKMDTNGVITTIAGNGSTQNSGDGVPAINARLFSPLGVAVDNSGNLFIADETDNRVRKVDVHGVITTVAGNGSSSYSGDGGPATSAGMDRPQRVVVDGLGNLWITEYNRVRKVDTNGIITTVAGNGTYGYSGDGGLAINASFDCLEGIALDGAGNLLIVDWGNGCIREVDALGIIKTVVGNVTWGFSDDSPASSGNLRLPMDLAFDRAGNLYISDMSYNRVRKVSCFSATTPNLTLPNVGSTNAGDYSVIVTSPYGCVTSSVVTLSVSAPLPPQNFTGLITKGTNLSLQFKGTPSYPYVLQTTTNLTPPVNWEGLTTNAADVDGVWKFGVTATNADSPARFYRVLGE